MHNPYQGVESVAEMIARLVCDYEARQAAQARKEPKIFKNSGARIQHNS